MTVTMHKRATRRACDTEDEFHMCVCECEWVVYANRRAYPPENSLLHWHSICFWGRMHESISVDWNKSCAFINCQCAKISTTKFTLNPIEVYYCVLCSFVCSLPDGCYTIAPLHRYTNSYMLNRWTPISPTIVINNIRHLLHERGHGHINKDSVDAVNGIRINKFTHFPLSLSHSPAARAKRQCPYFIIEMLQYTIPIDEIEQWMKSRDRDEIEDAWWLCASIKRINNKSEEW